MKILRTAFRLTTYAAAAYGGFAAFTFFRYGRPKKAGAKNLDAFIPDPEVIERHSIAVDAPPALTFKTACGYDMNRSRIAHLLFDTRSLVLGEPPAHAAGPAPFVEAMKTVGWAVLDEKPDEEIVFCAVARPWLADAAFRTVAPDDFTAFDEPGWVKIVFNIAVEATGVLRTETRVVTTDAEARKRFRKYWSFVLPGVKLIRLELLRGIKAIAEQAAQNALRSVAVA